MPHLRTKIDSGHFPVQENYSFYTEMPSIQLLVQNNTIFDTETLIPIIYNILPIIFLNF